MNARRTGVAAELLLAVVILVVLALARKLPNGAPWHPHGGPVHRRGKHETGHDPMKREVSR